MHGISFASVKCPWCQERIKVDPFNLITLTGAEGVRDKLLAGEYDQFPCPACNRDVPYSSPIVCNDVSNRVMIYYFPHPLPDELQETARDLLKNAIRGTQGGGLPAPEGEGWRICIAFGLDELKVMLSGNYDEESCL